MFIFFHSLIFRLKINLYVINSAVLILPAKQMSNFECFKNTSQQNLKSELETVFACRQVRNVSVFWLQPSYTFVLSNHFHSEELFSFIIFIC